MTEPVDYDLVAQAYDQRFERHHFEGVETALRRFISESGTQDAAEAGCGTGHWLAVVKGLVRTAAGIDLSAEMLRGARTTAPSALLARARAEALPWPSARFDRLFCINALHHFRDPEAFLREARRVLRPGGALLVIGLDPHAEPEPRWWIYDYFPASLDADRERYRSTASIRQRMEAVGFSDVATEIAHHLTGSVPFAEAKSRGLLDRRSASQLLVISDAEYEAGVLRLESEQPILRSDLPLYATAAWVRAS